MTNNAHESSTNILIEPNDVLMFRDGSPFNQNDMGASSAESMFPPPPPTIVGAIRLGIAQQLGFDGKEENWPEDKLGTGVDWQGSGTTLDPISFDALKLVRRIKGETETENSAPQRRVEMEFEALYPVPLHLAGSKIAGKVNGERYPECFLLPDQGDNNKSVDLFDCDQKSGDGDRIPYVSAPKKLKGMAPLENAWTTVAGMAAILSGKPPKLKEILFSEEIFKRETRVGIGIDPSDRVAKEGELYIAGFLRLRDDICFVQPMGGFGGEAEFLQRLGGEHRMAHFSTLNKEFHEVSPTPLEANKFVAITQSPTWFEDVPQAGQPIPGLPGKLVTAVMPKPFMLGGWNSIQTRPIPMRQILPAGSVYFMEINAEETIQPIAQIGSATQWGFGQCLVGKWPKQGT